MQSGAFLKKATARQFRQYCERIGAPIARAPQHIRRLFNPNYVDDVFAVKEYAFDALKLKKDRPESDSRSAISRLAITPRQNRYISWTEGFSKVTAQTPDGPICLTARSLLNCTYSRLNKLLIGSGLKPLYLKHEMTDTAW